MITTLWQRYCGALFLLLLVVVVNFNIVFQGQSLVATANRNPFDFRGMQRGEFRGGNQNVNWHDLGVDWWQWEPAGKTFSELYRAGKIHLWDSTLAGGEDAHIDVIQSQYYPPYILLLLAGDTPGLRDAYYLLEVFAAGLFCYLLLRAHNCHQLSAIGMGAVFMFSGAVTQNVNSIIGQSVCALPAMIWAIDLVLRRASWRSAGIASLVMAGATLSSFLPVVVSGYIVAGIFVAVDLAWRVFTPVAAGGRAASWRAWWPRSGKAFAALAGALLLVAFLLVPLRLVSSHSSVANWYSGVGLQHWRPSDMLSLVSPSVGYDVWQNQDPHAHLFASVESFIWYVGVIPLLLAVLGCFRAGPELRKLTVSFGAATAFIFLKMIGMPPAQWIGYLPFFRDMHCIPYFCGALAFGFAGLAGLGIESLVRHRDRVSLGMALLAVVALFLAILGFAGSTPVNPLLAGNGLWAVLAHYALEIARVALLAMAFLAIVILRATGFQRGKAAAGFMIGLVLLDLGPHCHRDRFLRSDAWSHPPDYIRFLQRDPGVFRVNGVDDLTVNANTSQPFGIQVLSSRLVFTSARFGDIVHQYFGAPRMLPALVVRNILPTDRALLDILNVKYLLVFDASSEEKQQLKSAGMAPLYHDGPFQIYQNPTVWDRAYLAGHAVVVREKQALDGLAHMRPGDVELEEQPAIPLSADSAAGSILNLHYGVDRISMHVHAAHPTLLVLDENYSAGWSAHVQGKKVPIYRANYSFQAVEVPAGDSAVEFSYTTPGLWIGCLLSLAGVGLAALMLFRRDSYPGATLELPS